MPPVLYVNKRTLQPGCVLIQAAMGGDRRLLDLFDHDDWQVDNIEEMAALPADRCEEAAEARKILRRTGGEIPKVTVGAGA